jgi:hypothetical protein
MEMELDTYASATFVAKSIMLANIDKLMAQCIKAEDLAFFALALPSSGWLDPLANPLSSSSVPSGTLSRGFSPRSKDSMIWSTSRNLSTISF